jgi:hypothetical protein
VFNLRFQNHATVYYELDSLKLPLQIGEGRGEVKGGKKMTIFQRFMADLWFSLFFHVSASKFIKTLIVNYASETNGMQREFLFNNGIHSQNDSSASSHPRQKTNLFKRFIPLSKWRGVRGEVAFILPHRLFR